MKHRILNLIPEFSDKGKKIISRLGRVDYKLLNQAELKRRVKNYDILVVRLENKVDREIIDNAPNLKIIATATTGLDHIDTIYAGKKGIKVLSLKGETKFLNSVTSTAELAFGLMINFLRHVVPAVDSVRAGQWDIKRFRGSSLPGKVIGIVGLGRLGKMMARFGRAFGMRVIAFDPYVKAAKSSFQQLLKKSDVISIHVHLNPRTEGMFGKKEFAAMKKSAYLVNTARGKIVNEPELLKALKAKKIAGYATDVLSAEGNTAKLKTDPLIRYTKTHSNVIITPHIGGLTHESREVTDVFIAEKIFRLAWKK